MKITLEDIIDDLSFETLPVNWTAFDMSSFSRQKQLWDYQQRALKNGRTLSTLPGNYYQVRTDDTLSYEQFLNRTCFWMATGSGKTLVIIKLVEILQELIRPVEDIK